MPKYLYHYTSIENFAMILKNRTIRFNALKCVDDLTEGKSKDLEEIGSYFFVSCWTDDSKESLPFWKMYTPDMKGVRLKMPINLFKTHRVKVEYQEGFRDGIYKSIVPQEKSFGGNYWVVPTLNDYLEKVKYTNNNNKLKPKIKTINGVGKNNLNLIGIYKSKHWEFQSEWRYILKIFPKSRFSIRIKKLDPKVKFNPKSFVPSSLRRSISIEDFYLEIDESKFKMMEVTLGPRHTISDYEIVKCILQIHNPNAINNLRISELKGKIR